MNPKRTQALLSGQTAISTKVYNCVPIESAWTTAQIHGELRRQGVNRDPRTVRGCLSSLLEDGLVREPIADHYIRTPVRDKTKLAVVPASNQEEVTMAVPEVKQRTPIDILTDLSLKARELTRAIEQAAVDIEEQFNFNTEENKKLKQLQQLLKNLV